MKIGVTGGSGFLGQHLLRKLRDAQIEALSRPSSSFRFLPSNARIIEGDCLTGQGLADLARNKDVLVHMAFLLFGTGWQNYLQTNIAACQNLVSAVQSLPAAERPGKIIFVSSLAASGPCAISPGKNEKEAPSPVSAYGWSKLLCENILAKAFGDSCVILRPAIIYGSGDKGLLPMFRAAGKGIGLSPGFNRVFPVSAIHADDAASAIILAFQENARGIYHLDDGKAYDMGALCKAMAHAQGKRNCHVINMPLPVMGASAFLSESFGRLVRKLPGPGKNSRAPQWNLDKYREARQVGWLGDSSRIRSELGFKTEMDLAQGMKEAVEGYHAAGLL